MAGLHVIGGRVWSGGPTRSAAPGLDLPPVQERQQMEKEVSRVEAAFFLPQSLLTEGNKKHIFDTKAGFAHR